MEIDLMPSVMEKSDITTELKRLWDEEKGKNRVRACFFNLVIYADAEKKEITTLIESVISKFPCRVLLVSLEKESSTLKTSVTAAAITEEIFCEIIHIQVGKEMEERLPYLVLPHILPDLPLHLLWTTDPLQDKTLLPALEPYAKRLILDSSSLFDLQAFSKNVLAASTQYRCEVGDLNWSALRSWRKIFRSVFDSRSSMQALEQTKSLRIRYCKERESLRACYLQGWLAAQLEWKFIKLEKTEKQMRLLYEKEGNEIEVFLIPEASSLPFGSILAIELTSSFNKAEYAFKRHEKSAQVFIQRSDKFKCDLPYCTMLTGMKEGLEIIQEIFYTAGGTQYKKMLTTLSGIPWNS